MRFMFLTLDVLKLSGWLKAVACCRVRARIWGGAVVVAQAAHRAAGARLRVWATGLAHAERTQNISCMFVTPEVSHREMSALNPFWLETRLLMSVMDETSQLAMRPYVAMATVGFEL